MTRTELLDTLRLSDMFDATWYRTQYPDVDMSGINPAEHYFDIGKRLTRDPGPAFDAGFYCGAYNFLHPSQNPLLDYETAAHQSRRDCTRDALDARMTKLAQKTATAWGALKQGLEVSYCIPVLNRLDDIKDTLPTNLNDNAAYRGRIEFLLMIFDETDGAETWVREHFGEALEDGYLRVVREPDVLDSWHFGKAKNAFRRHIKGHFFSSLDGDNFVTAAETEALLGLIETHPDGFVFHHFSGTFGDGTSGRVTMPTPVYREVGYDPLLLPRQYDEVDFMLGALTRFPALPLIGTDPTRNILSLSQNARNYSDNEKLVNRQLFVTYPERRPPLNPRGESYQRDESFLNNMNNLNAAMSARRRSGGSVHWQDYEKKIQTHKHRLLDCLPERGLLDILFETNSARIHPGPLGPDDIPLFACVRNEEGFLAKFVTHYRSLGVTRFFLVDDHSDRPVSALDLGDGVSVVRPKVGDFKSSKTLWLESLMRVFVDEGAWVVVADADEFLQMPEPYTDLRSLQTDLEDRALDTCPGLLLDMVPGQIQATGTSPEFDVTLNSFCYRDVPVSPDYGKITSVNWAFGPHNDISWRVDLRYHAFRTVDSLRKFPFFRLREGIHLNQGFHAFHPTIGWSMPKPTIWTEGPILPIFHYKLARLYVEESRLRMLGAAGKYHDRTSGNIKKIFGDPGASREAIAQQAQWFVPAGEALKEGRFRA